MSAYLIAQISITDRTAYSAYEDGFMEIFQRFKGKMLAVDEKPDVLEGEWPCTRTVLVEFPSKEEALAWYRSDDYQALAQHRFSASDGNTVMVNGFNAA